jgi:hypothetical protein
MATLDHKRREATWALTRPSHETDSASEPMPMAHVAIGEHDTTLLAGRGDRETEVDQQCAVDP